MKLLPFQAADVARLSKMRHALIGHQQGLGKTVIASQLATSGTIIVCPSSVRLNWRNELAVWRPDLRVQVMLSGKDQLDNDTQVVIISYDLLDRVELPACYTLIVDESHYIKNRKAKRSKNVARAAKYADNVYLLSGTPMPNRTRELWTQLTVLGATDMSYFKFTENFSGGFRDRFGWHDDGATNIPELQAILDKVMVRRLKADVLTELPAKRHQIIPLEGRVSREERDLAERAALAIREHGKLTPDTVPFEEMSEYRKLTGERKVEQAIAFVRDALVDNHKVVVFAHHADVIELLRAALEVHGVVTITGKTAAKDRQAAVDAFQTDPDVRVFIGNLTAAGEGITLTAASTVIVVELDWVPGKLDQATDRVHRIGQTKQVLCQYLVTENGLDHRLLEALLEKQDVIETVIDGARGATA